MIEVYPRDSGLPYSRVTVSHLGSIKSFENEQAAFEHLDGKVRELQAAVDTAKAMYVHIRLASENAKMEVEK